MSSLALIVDANGLGSTCVLKSQILSGGRAKGTFDSGLVGGIQVVSKYIDPSMVINLSPSGTLGTKY
jgi:succinyl-CoA synthetase beta subunit